MGGDGNDTLSGGAGDNRWLGEAGNDTYVVAAGGSNSIYDYYGSSSYVFGRGLVLDDGGNQDRAAARDRVSAESGVAGG